ncbi:MULTISPECIES: hypothetical protein [Vibrio]|uniref:Uncharacterized protein n=1 Tax=Vibrio cholerae TaxID=666 RepID=A0A8B5ZL65_VIBCL|nr:MULTISPECIES: hypothetical protein [Vibrio]TXY93627.1 hypothetical protein FXE67_03725 [Vibrio cholerae]TXZ10960.1 hypothetical protein FXE57_10455 [Vibrio cholerae]TYA67701.1 hypothetical protein FXE28_00545 [Vibrio cholerae]BCK22226.1 hypothetical protein VCSRO51_2653 [Vibrio cholerae]GHZ17707.1 hypothetical protein VCSRO78_2535 [Vibrio cholerae]
MRTNKMLCSRDTTTDRGSEIMNLFAVCITCSQTKGVPLLNKVQASYFDDRVVRTKCNQGHDMAIIVRAPKFEVLLESGADALNLGFTLEASSSFSAALERFYEFAINIILKQQGMGEDVYQKMFKAMSRQSERQLGSFLALHALFFGEAYAPNNKITEFRNAVIHKGTIPTPDEAKNFCSLVYEEIYKIGMLLKDHCKREIELALEQDFKARASKVPSGVRVHGSQKSSIYNMLGENNKPTFEEALVNYNNFNKTLERAINDMPIFAQIMERPEVKAMIDSIRPFEQ